MKITWQQEYVKCGKKNCRSCPHGPYWYGYWKENGKTRSRYGGKVGPGNAPKPLSQPADPRELMFRKETASRGLALHILGLGIDAKGKEVKDRYRTLVLQLHPDRGGDTREMQFVVAAYSYLKAGLFL